MNYYSSSTGLGKSSALRHPFRIPVEILATNRFLRQQGDSIYSHQWVGTVEFRCPPPRDVRDALRACSGHNVVPMHLEYLIGPGSRGTTLCAKAFNVVCDLYQVTRDIKALFRSQGFDTGDERGSLSNRARLAVDAESTRRFLLGEEGCTPVSGLGFSSGRNNRYRKALERLEASRATFDCVALAFQEIKRRFRPIPRKGLRALASLKSRIVSSPFEVATSLKSIAAQARAAYFGAPLPQDPLVCWMTHPELLAFSYVARALPSPLRRDETEAVTELANRLVGDPAPEVRAWRPFVRSTLARLLKLGGSPAYWTEPSNSAAIGYARKTGGHMLSYQHIVLYEIASRMLETGSDFLPPECSTEDADRLTMGMFGLADEPALPTYPKDIHPSFLFWGAKGGNNAFSWLDETRTVVATEDEFPRLGSALSAYNDLMHPGRGQSAEGWWSHVVSQLGDVSALNEYLSLLLVEGSKRILRMVPSIPVLAIVAPEKGMKTRLPTTTLTAAHIVMQPLRTALDELLRRDSRVSESLGGRLRMSLAREEGMWYSQDLSTATDCHPFWLTRTVYEELILLVPSLKWTEEFFDKLFGPRRLILPCVIPRPAPKFEGVAERLKPEAAMFAVKPNLFRQAGFDESDLYEPVVLDLTLADCLAWGVVGTRMPSYLMTSVSGFRPGAYVPVERAKVLSQVDLKLSLSQFWVSYSEALASWASLPHVETRRGAMMGDPTSWPVMPLATMFCARHVRVKKFLTCGDDALLPNMDQEKREAYDAMTARLGGVISKPKSFLHRSKGIFCEKPYVRGVPKPFTLLSYWVAPPGGSKGEVNWFNLPTSYSGFRSQQGLPSGRRALKRTGLWNFTLHNAKWKAAHELGIPIGGSDLMGGIGHPTYPKVPLRRRRRWGSYLSSRSVRDLVLFGGLSLVPNNGDPHVGKEMSRLIGPLLDFSTEGGEGVDVRKFLRSIKNPRTMTSLYLGGWSTVSRDPSVSNLAAKFRRKLLTNLTPGPFPRSDLLEKDLLRKMDRKVNLPIPDFVGKRQFGLSAHGAPLFDGRKPFTEHSGPT
jgi:hypothetical protein